MCWVKLRTVLSEKVGLPYLTLSPKKEAPSLLWEISIQGPLLILRPHLKPRPQRPLSHYIYISLSTLLINSRLNDLFFSRLLFPSQFLKNISGKKKLL
jgi:hypothetical protein